MSDTTSSVGREKKFPIIELFGPTLQGEGFVIGMQTMFVRFGGCDYRCEKCDSLHAVLPALIKANATYMTAIEIADALEAKRMNCNMVTFSGGNPLMHNLTELVEILQDRDWCIAVETQGTLHHKWVNNVDYITISPKGPGMGETFELDKLVAFVNKVYPMNMAEINLKVVIFDQRDIEFAKAIASEFQEFPLYLSLGNPWPPEPAQADHPIPDFTKAALLSRMAILWEQIKQEPLLSEARFLPQMHVLLWGNERNR